jgi:uncharacterized protein
MSNLEAVKTIYEAFGRGDVPTFLSLLADDVDWELWEDNFAQQYDVPYLRYKKGAANVVGFFQEVARLGIKEFKVLSVMEGANQIAAEIEIETAMFRDEEIHLWTFNADGKVSRFRHYVDTAKHIAAAEKARSSTAA